jgi:hypothetical protein
VLREGTTGAANQVNFKFRTQGQFQISITSPKPNTPYKMVVWVGNDLKPKLKPIFVPAAGFKDGGTPKWVWWAGGGAGLVIIVLVVMLMRRKPS